MRLTTDDLRLMIERSRSRGVKDFDQFNRLSLQFRHPPRRDQSTMFGDFNPQISFVGFLQNDGDFVNKIRARLAAQRRTIIRRHRTATPCDLIGNGLSRRCPGQGIRKFHYPDRKLKGSFLELFISHGACLLSKQGQPFKS